MKRAKIEETPEVPIHDLDAEGVVISTMLLAPERVPEIENICKEADFYSLANRLIFSAISALSSENKGIDLVSVATRLRETGTLQSVGGAAYIAQIADATPAISNVNEHARRIAKLGQQRRIGEVAARIAAEAKREQRNGWDTQCISSIESCLAIDKEESVVSLRDAVREWNDRPPENKKAIISTGFQALDNLIGGWRPGTLSFLAGRPGSGKTSLAWSLAMNAARAGVGVFICSEEMLRESIVDRAVSGHTSIDTSTMEKRDFNPHHWKLIAAALAEFSRLPIVIEDEGPQSLASIRRKIQLAARKLKETYGVELGLVFIDYLQLTTEEGLEARSREEAISRVSKGFLQTAKRLKVPVVALSQLSRKCDERTDKRPQLSDLRESGSLEQDAWTVVGLYNDAYYNPESARHGIVEAIVLKQRQGGSVGTAELRWHAPTCCFSDMSAPDRSIVRAANEVHSEWDDAFGVL